MDDGRLAARHAASQRAFYAAITPSMPGGIVLTLAGGVQAAIAPAVPSRSLFNLVVYDDAEALVAQRDGLQGAYDASGIQAWAVWTRPGHDVVSRALEAAGHSLDGRPVLMGTELDALDLDPRAEPSLDLELDADPAWDEIAEVNAAARGARPEVSFRPAMDHLFRVAVRGWLARVGGRPAAALITYLHEEDCYVTFVATLPEFRGHDLRRELLRAALRAARGAGATSSTLEATMLGAQVYSRLGYRPLGELSVWERRRAE